MRQRAGLSSVPAYAYVVLYVRTTLYAPTASRPYLPLVLYVWRADEIHHGHVSVSYDLCTYALTWMAPGPSSPREWGTEWHGAREYKVPMTHGETFPISESL